MNMEYKEFVDFCKKTCEKMQEKLENHEIDDWEQEFFNALDDKFDTDTQEVLSFIYYSDDDSIDDVAQGLLYSLQDRKLLRWTCFDIYDGAIVIVAITSKKDTK